jgi:chromatin modification-related protein VID21
MAAMQDPKLMQMMSQNPMAQQMQAAALAHINEHIAFEYRKQMEEQLGVPLPNPDETLPEDVEFELSKVMAAAAQKLLAKDQAEAQQQQAQQQAQDPLIQMQQAELQIKQQEAQAKAQKMMADAQLDQQRLELEKMKIESQERIAGAQLGAKTEMEKAKLEAQQTIEGVKIGVQTTQASKEQDQKLRAMTIDAIDRLASHEQSVQDRTHTKQQAANQFVQQMAQMQQKAKMAQDQMANKKEQNQQQQKE